MKYHFTGRQIDISPALRKSAEERLGKLDRFLDHLMEAHVILAVEKRRHRAEVVVHGRQTADNGEMVIALVNGSEATVKRYYREPGGWVRLQPSHPSMQPLRFQEDDVMVQGVVVGVIRRYQ